MILMCAQMVTSTAAAARAVSAPYLVQPAVYGRRNGGTFTLTLLKPPAAGNRLIIFGAGKDGNPGVSAIPGFTQDFYDGSQSFQGVWLYERTAVAGDGASVSVPLSAISGYANVVFAELANVATLSYSHGAPSTSKNTSIGMAGGNTTANSLATAFALLEQDNPSAKATGGSGWSLLHTFGNDGGNHAAAFLQFTGVLANGQNTSTPAVTWNAVPSFGIAATLTITSTTLATSFVKPPGVSILSLKAAARGGAVYTPPELRIWVIGPAPRYAWPTSSK